MRIATCSLDALASAIKGFDPTAIVSAFSPGFPVPTVPGRPHLTLAFHDIEHAVAGRRTGPVHGHVASLVAFLARHRPERLLVHCHAGLSRSPALAVVASVAQGSPVDAAVELLRAAVPEASPNRRVVALGDAVLGTGGAMARSVGSAFAVRRDMQGAVGELTGLRVW